MAMSVEIAMKVWKWHFELKRGRAEPQPAALASEATWLKNRWSEESKTENW